MFLPADHSDVPEFGCAHATDTEHGTGCTVFVAREGAACGVDVRGGGPASRETDLLKPENMIQKVHAVMISGGSAFGLESACGAMEALAAQNIGFNVGPVHVPIVPAACLFDLLIGEPVWPDKSMGFSACKDALAHPGHVLEMGNVGAGCGATVGKMGLPEQAMKSGFGWCGIRLGALTLIANVAVNALGNVMDEQGEWIAGPHNGNEILSPFEAAMTARAHIDTQTDTAPPAGVTENTTLGVILTNADLTKAQCTKVAQITQDAYARTIKPVHTLNDGDTVFVMASGKVEAETDIVAMMATEAMENAIRCAVMSADSAYGLTCARDIASNDASL